MAIGRGLRLVVFCALLGPQGLAIHASNVGPIATATFTARPSPTPFALRGPLPHPLKVGPPKSLKAAWSPAATPVPGSVAALLYTTSADSRVVTDLTAFGNNLNTATYELRYLGVAHARTDFTCDNAVFAGCDARNLVTTYFSQPPFPSDYWVVLPYTAGALNIANITGFQIPTLQGYGNTLHAIEDGNEVNNNCSPSGPGMTYNGLPCGCSGSGPWTGCPTWDADYYNAVKAAFPGMPVYSWSNPFAQPENDLMQFVGSLTPGGHPVQADYADVHNYIQGNAYNGPVDNVVGMSYELGTGGYDNGMTGNFCVSTASYGFPAVPAAQCAKVPRVSTETGMSYGAPNTSEEARAAMLTNAFIIGYMKGWSLVSIYAVADDTSTFGLFQNGAAANPYQAATAIHNLTTILVDPIGASFAPNTMLPAITGKKQPTDYALQLQKYNGVNTFIATGDRPVGEHVEKWTLGGVPSCARIYDPLQGTAPIGTGNTITVDDHPVIVQWGGTAPTPTATATPTTTPTPTPR